MNKKDIDRIIKILTKEVKKWELPIVTEVARRDRSPFKVLVSCILSLRTKDKTTAEASARLFSLADTPGAMGRLSVKTIEQAIYPVGFYRNKAAQVKEISKTIASEYSSVVPDEIDELLKFKGVGRKTANLVVTIGYGKPGICVDTHVHRITNRWGYIKTRAPEETEQALRKILPPKHWIVINDLLVAFGQNHCSPVSPHCSTCKLYSCCERVGVKTSR